MASNFSSFPSSFSQSVNENSGNRVVVYVQPASEVSVTPVLASDYLNLHTRPINAQSAVNSNTLYHHSPTRTSPRSHSLISHVATPPRASLGKSNFLTPTRQSQASSDVYTSMTAAARRGLPIKFPANHLAHTETLKSSTTTSSRTRTHGMLNIYFHSSRIFNII